MDKQERRKVDKEMIEIRMNYQNQIAHMINENNNLCRMLMDPLKMLHSSVHLERESYNLEERHKAYLCLHNLLENELFSMSKYLNDIS